LTTTTDPSQSPQCGLLSEGCRGTAVTIGRVTIAILGLLSVACRLWPEQDPAVAFRLGEHRIPFQVRNGLIYIPARVNGQKVTLLLDTGTVQTSFSLKIAPAKSTDSKIKVNMARGSMLAFRTPVDFTIGGPDLKEHRCSFSENVVVGDFTFEGA